MSGSGWPSNAPAYDQSCSMRSVKGVDDGGSQLIGYSRLRQGGCECSREGEKKRTAIAIAPQRPGNLGMMLPALFLDLTNLKMFHTFGVARDVHLSSGAGALSLTAQGNQKS